MYLNFELYKSCCRPPGEKIYRILIVDDSVLQETISVWESHRMKVKPNSSVNKVGSKSQHHQPITPVMPSCLTTTTVVRHEKTDGLVSVMCLSVHTHTHTYRCNFCMS